MATDTRAQGAIQGAATGTAISPGWGTAIGAGAGLLGSILGDSAADEANDQAQRLRDAALAQFANLNIPDTDKMSLFLEEMKSSGMYSPEMEQALTLGPSSMENINIDPRLRATQLSALEQVSGIAKNGLSDADMASLELIRRQAAGEAQAKQGQILQNMQARGQGGSGAELIAKIQSAQSSADRLNQQALEEAKMMQQARMQALQQQGNMSGQIRSQDYGEQTDAAKARDAINQFNLLNQQQTSQRNTSNKNTAQQQNLANQQQIMNQNAALHNQQQQYNKNLQQQNFNNQMQLANSKAAAMQGRASGYQDQAARQATSTGQMWQGIGQLGAGAVNAFNQPKKTEDDGFGDL